MGRTKGAKQHKRPINKRFWEKVDIRRDDECWEWVRYRNGQGYGIFGVDGKLLKSHRVAWMLTNGPIPDGMFVCHHCDNPPCCNPKHLFLGTVKDNAIDMVRKGRAKPNILKGDDCPWSKTNSATVIEIRRLYDSGTKTQAELSRMFQMSTGQIGKIVHRVRWRHI